MTDAWPPVMLIPEVAAPAWRRLSDALGDSGSPCASDPERWFSTQLASQGTAAGGGVRTISSTDCTRCGASVDVCRSKVTLNGRPCCPRCTHPVVELPVTSGTSPRLPAERAL